MTTALSALLLLPLLAACIAPNALAFAPLTSSTLAQKRASIGVSSSREQNAFLTSSSSFSSSSPTTISMAATSSTDPTSSITTRPPTSQQFDSVIVGGGPAGLLSAIMLAQKFPTQTVSVYDRLPSPPSPTDESVWNDVARFYLIGLGHRGQRALDRFGVWDEVEAVSAPVVGRKDWSPGAGPEEGTERLAGDKPTTTMVLPRDKLVGVLHRHILDNYADRIELNYEHQVVPLDFGDDAKHSVQLGVSECSVVAADETAAAAAPEAKPEAECDVDNYRVVRTNLLIGSDGAARTIANAMEERDAERIRNMSNPIRRLFSKGGQFKVKRFVDDNKRVYKTVPVKLPSDWKYDLNYSARSNGNRITFEALPSDDEGSYCALLLMREDDEFAQRDADPAKLRRFFDDEFAQFGPLIDDKTLAKVAAKPCSNLPQFRYAGPRLNEGDRTTLLGDAIHTVKPYYGLGANTALEDVSLLADAFDDESNEEESDSGANAKGAVRRFSDKRAGDSNALVTISRNMDRPGKLGLAAFLVPIILDGIFHKLAPWIFAPSMFAMFQKEGVTFRGMQRRKRQDRLVQLALVGCVLGGVAAGVKALVSAVGRAIGKSDGFVGGVMLASVVLVASLRKVLASSSSGMEKVRSTT